MYPAFYLFFFSLLARLRSSSCPSDPKIATHHRVSSLDFFARAKTHTTCVRVLACVYLGSALPVLLWRLFKGKTNSERCVCVLCEEGRSPADNAQCATTMDCLPPRESVMRGMSPRFQPPKETRGFLSSAASQFQPLIRHSRACDVGIPERPTT